MNKWRWSTPLSLCLLVGCAGQKGAERAPEQAEQTKEVQNTEQIGPVPLMPKSGSSVGGTVAMEEVNGKVHVTVMVTGAPPGKHGVHVHEKGDCSAPDAASAGGHYNPEGHPHGLPSGEGSRHLGDFGNIEIKEDGTGTMEITVEGATLDEGGPMSFRDKALIVHAQPDTGEQPTGGAGGRIACAELRSV